MKVKVYIDIKLFLLVQTIYKRIGAKSADIIVFRTIDGDKLLGL
jgi:hypothetical protein